MKTRQVGTVTHSITISIWETFLKIFLTPNPLSAIQSHHLQAEGHTHKEVKSTAQVDVTCCKVLKYVDSYYLMGQHFSLFALNTINKALANYFVRPNPY